MTDPKTSSLPGLQALIEQWRDNSRFSDEPFLHRTMAGYVFRRCADELEKTLAVDPMMVNPADDLESLRWQLQNALRRIQELSALLVVQGGVQQEENEQREDDPRSRCGSAAPEGQDLRVDTPTSDAPTPATSDELETLKREHARELDELQGGRWRTFKRDCPRTFPNIPMTPADCSCVDCVEIRNERDANRLRVEHQGWRDWAAFVWGAPRSGSDDELRIAVCAAHDAEIRALREQQAEYERTIRHFQDELDKAKGR